MKTLDIVRLRQSLIFIMDDAAAHYSFDKYGFVDFPSSMKLLLFVFRGKLCSARKFGESSPKHPPTAAPRLHATLDTFTLVILCVVMVMLAEPTVNDSNFVLIRNFEFFFDFPNF